MSVRAYKVVQPVVTADAPTFSVNGNGEIQDYLAHWEADVDGGGGSFETTAERIREMLDATDEERGFSLDDDTRKSFEADIAGLELDEYISYECF